MNRGLYSNEAGQGSAPIAHASSKTENPIEEGMVSILEPFIDTIIICTITGLVILSSGVWTEKFENRFEESAMCYLDGSYSDQNQDDIYILQNYILSCSGPLVYSGTEEVKRWTIIKYSSITLMHNRSVAEQIIYKEDGEPLSGSIEIKNGKFKTENITIVGDSLLLELILLERLLLGVYLVNLVNILLL